MLLTGRRAFTLGLLLASLLVGGWKGLIPHVGSHETSEIATAAAFARATAALDGYREQTGSYSGLSIDPTSPVRVGWAEADRYCLQGGGLYEVGPGGLPQPGGCPPG